MSTDTLPALSSLTDAQRYALELAARIRIVRVTNGWRGRGTRLIRLETARALIAQGLARDVIVNFTRELTATAEGRNVLKRGRA